MKNLNINFYTIIALALIFMGSCKKKTELNYIIEGKVFDPNYNTSVSKANVKLYSKEVSGGSFSGNYTLKATAKSGVNGDYIFEFNRTNVVDYKIEVEINNYFKQSKTITQESLEINNSNKVDLEIFPKAFVKLNVINSTPVNQYDYIDIYFDKSSSLPNCNNCTGQQRYIIEGDVVDTVLVSEDWSNKELQMQYVTIKNGADQVANKSIFLNIGDTTTVDIFY